MAMSGAERRHVGVGCARRQGWRVTRAAIAGIAVAAMLSVPGASGEAAASTAEPAPLESLSITLSTPVAVSNYADYTISFVTPYAIPAAGTVTLMGPAGTLWPASACSYALVDRSAPAAGVSCPAQAPKVHFADSGLPIYNYGGVTGAAVSVEVPTAIKAGAALQLMVDGATNPGPAATRSVPSLPPRPHRLPRPPTPSARNGCCPPERHPEHGRGRGTVGCL